VDSGATKEREALPSACGDAGRTNFPCRAILTSRGPAPTGSSNRPCRMRERNASRQNCHLGLLLSFPNRPLSRDPGRADAQGKTTPAKPFRDLMGQAQWRRCGSANDPGRFTPYPETTLRHVDESSAARTTSTANTTELEAKRGKGAGSRNSTDRGETEVRTDPG